MLIPAYILLMSNLIGTDSLPDIKEQQLFDIKNITYQGAFRIPAQTFGASSANWANGIIAYNHRNHSLFLSGIIIIRL